MIAEHQITKAKPAPPAAPPADDTLPRGAEVLLHALVNEGVDTIFGYPGGAVLHIYDELWRYRERVTHYLVRHEQGAVHMAEGYARASGRVGVTGSSSRSASASSAADAPELTMPPPT